MPSPYSRILKYTSLFGSVQVFTILLSVVRNKLTALLIGPAGMGIADVMMRTLDFLANTTNLGIGLNAVRRLSAFHDAGDARRTLHYVRLVRTWALFAAALGFVVALALAPLLSLWNMGTLAATPSFLALAPVVAFSTLTVAEVAILKAIRQLRQLATVTALGAVSTLLITAPLYFALGTRGIVPVIGLTTLACGLLTLRVSCRQFPYRVGPFRRRFVRQGNHLLRLGIAYFAAGMAGSGAEMLIRSELHRLSGSWDVVGLYAAGFTLTVAYARLVFVAMDADYFPRLSVALEHGPAAMNETINRQTDVLVMLIVPVLIAFGAALPIIIPLLYTSAFLAIIPMVLCALSYMYFKAVFSPAAYLPLAAGNAGTYMSMEIAYDVPFALLVLGGFKAGGLVGAGIGLALSNAWNLLLVWTVYARRYAFRPERSTMVRALLQGLCLAAGLAAATLEAPLPRYALAALALALSVGISAPMIRGVVEDVRARFRR